MKINKKIFVVIIFIAFIGTFYWVEFSKYSSQELTCYNDGYGTFDMKNYDNHDVYNVLNNMEPKGFEIYNKYLIGDYLFVISFGALQVIISLFIFNWLEKGVIKKCIISLPILRGIFDVVENTMLFMIINGYPERYKSLVSISATATWLKLFIIKIWCVAILIGLFIKIILKIRKS